MSDDKKAAPAGKEQVGFYRALSEADAKRVQAEFQEKGFTAEVKPWVTAEFGARWDVFAFKK
jgi:hypothetical protein